MGLLVPNSHCSESAWWMQVDARLHGFSARWSCVLPYPLPSWELCYSLALPFDGVGLGDVFGEGGVLRGNVLSPAFCIIPLLPFFFSLPSFFPFFSFFFFWKLGIYLCRWSLGCKGRPC